MISILISTLFWNNVLNAELPKDPQLSSHKAWKTSSVLQDKEARNKKFYKNLTRSSKIIKTTKSPISSIIRTRLSKNVLIVGSHLEDEML